MELYVNDFYGASTGGTIKGEVTTSESIKFQRQNVKTSFGFFRLL
jgi:hypothetical protein